MRCPRRSARFHGLPRVHRALPHLLDPLGHRLVVPLRREPGRDLTAPFIAHQQLAYALAGVAFIKGERRPVTVRIRLGVRCWCRQPCAAGPLASSASRWVNRFSVIYGSGARPLGRARGPASAHVRRHRRTDGGPSAPTRAPGQPQARTDRDCRGRVLDAYAGTALASDKRVRPPYTPPAPAPPPASADSRAPPASAPQKTDSASSMRLSGTRLSSLVASASGTR